MLTRDVLNLLKRTSCQKTQKAFRYVILLPHVPECGEDNEFLNCIQNGVLPAYNKQIPFNDALEGTAKLALEFEMLFSDHCLKLSDVHTPKNFGTVIEPLCKGQSQIDYAWGTLRLMHKTMSFEDADKMVNAKIRLKGIRNVVSRCLASQYNNDVFSRALKEVAADRQFLNSWQSTLVDRYLIETDLNAAGRDPKKRLLLEDIHRTLKLATGTFWLNVKQTSAVRVKQIKIPETLGDLPHCFLYEWALYPDQYLKGPYYVPLTNAGYTSFLQYCRERLARYNHFVYWNSKASFKESTVTMNNASVIEDIRVHRRDEARALGFKSFAELASVTKMAYSLDETEDFLVQLGKKCKGKFISRLADMQLYARKYEMVADPLKPWDYLFYARKLIETATRFNSAEFASSLPFPRTWRNLLNLTEKMFNIQYVDVTEKISRWHDSVRVLSVKDCATGEEKGLIYLDFYVRPGKSQDNWVSHGRSSSQATGYRPIAYLSCNVMTSEKVEKVPMSIELLSFLAKGIGDCLSIVLSASPYSLLSSGQSLETDGSKVCANFMKWLVLEPTILSRLSSGRISVQDADIVREVYIESAVPILLRECMLSEFDLTIYNSTSIFWRDIYKDMHKRYYDKPVDKNDSFPCSFFEIMVEEQAAGYYGSLWSEMIACDLFNAFKESDCFENDASLAQMGNKLKDTFWSLYGGRRTREIFKQFRGRDLKFDHMFDCYKLNS